MNKIMNGIMLLVTKPYGNIYLSLSLKWAFSNRTRAPIVFYTPKLCQCVFFTCFVVKLLYFQEFSIEKSHKCQDYSFLPLFLKIDINYQLLVLSASSAKSTCASFSSDDSS